MKRISIVIGAETRDVSKIATIELPTGEEPYWGILFTDGTKIGTTAPVTVKYAPELEGEK